MQLADNADVVPARSIDRNDRLGAELKLVGHVDNAGIDRSSGALLAIEIADLAFKAQLHDRNQTIDKLRQAEIAHARFEIGHAVLQRAAPRENLRIVYRLKQPALLVERGRRGLSWNRIADLCGDREGATAS